MRIVIEIFNLVMLLPIIVIVSVFLILKQTTDLVKGFLIYEEKITDTIQDIIIKISGSNPGCMTFLVDLLKINVADFYTCCLKLDMTDMTGSEIYQLWNDCCNRNTKKTRDVIIKYKQKELIALVRNGKIYSTKVIKEI